MPEFVCRVGAPDGSVLEQRRLAVSEAALRRELEAEGFHVFDISGARFKLRIPVLGRREKVKSEEFLIFNTQLRTLIRAGLPLAQSLDLLRTQQSNPYFRSLLDKVYQQVTTGVSLSDAFLSLGDVFPRLYANTLRAGERSGELENVLDRYVAYQRLMEEARKKIISALTYPAVLVVLSIGLVILLFTKVIPTFSEFFAQFGAQLPLITRAIMGLATFVHDHFFLLAAAVTAMLVSLRMWARTASGRMMIDRWKLKLPVLGKVFHLFALSQFTRSLGVLLGGGTPMVPALQTASTSVGNTFVSEQFLACVPRVQEGQALSDTLERTKLVPELATAMVKVGESTGALPEMLTHTSGFLDSEIDHTLNRIVTLFEPFILVVMGGVVAGMLLAVYYPLLTLVSQMH